MQASLDCSHSLGVVFLCIREDAAFSVIFLNISPTRMLANSVLISDGFSATLDDRVSCALDRPSPWKKQLECVSRWSHDTVASHQILLVILSSNVTGEYHPSPRLLPPLWGW